MIRSPDSLVSSAAEQSATEKRDNAHLHNRFQPLLGGFDLGFQEIQRRQFLFHGFATLRRQFRQPSAELQTSSDTKKIRSRHLQVVTRERAMDAILHARAQMDQKDTQAEQLALVA